MSAVMTADTDRKSARKVSSGSSNRQRTAQINLRVKPAERDELERRAADLRFSGTIAYIRHLLALDPAV